MILYALLQTGIFLQFIGPGSGRLGITIIGLVGLINLIVARQAMRRSARGINSAKPRAIFALVVGIIVGALAVIHLVTSTGGFGTGNGRAGAIVAMLVGLAGMLLGAIALVRSEQSLHQNRTDHESGC